jgi:predicted RNase H-like HicB family nuclease
VQFEVEVYRDDAGLWVATAVLYNVSATGHSEKEALARVMEALAQHFKQGAR